jgi:hypothetical protein
MDIVERLRSRQPYPLDAVGYLINPDGPEAANEIERERGRSDHFIGHGIRLAKTIRELERICPNVPRHFWIYVKNSYSVFMQEEKDWLERRVEWEKKCFGDPPELVFKEGD